MMRIDPDKPGLVDLLKGEGDLGMRVIAWLGAPVLPALFLAGLMAAVGLPV